MKLAGEADLTLTPKGPQIRNFSMTVLPLQVTRPCEVVMTRMRESQRLDIVRQLSDSPMAVKAIYQVLMKPTSLPRARLRLSKAILDGVNGPDLITIHEDDNNPLDGPGPPAAAAVPTTASRGPLHTLGDIDLSGSVNVIDLLAVINGWGACPTPPAPLASGHLSPRRRWRRQRRRPPGRHQQLGCVPGDVEPIEADTM